MSIVHKRYHRCDRCHREVPDKEAHQREPDAPRVELSYKATSQKTLDAQAFSWIDMCPPCEAEMYGLMSVVMKDAKLARERAKTKSDA